MKSLGRTDSMLAWIASGQGIALMAVLVTALIRAWFLLQFQQSPLFPLFASAHDRMLYHEAASAVARGQVWPAGAFGYMPLYPWLLGAVYAVLGPSLTAAALLGAFADCITVASLVILARRWGAHWLAVAFSAALFAFYPLAIAYSALTMPNSINGMLVTALVLVLDRAQLNRWRDAVGVGIVGGIAALGFAGTLTLMIIYWGWQVARGWRERQTPWRGICVSACLLAVILLPVAVHNTRAEGDFVLLTTHGGFNFYMGNHERATGYPVRVENFRMTALLMLEDAHAFAEQAAGRELSQAESSAWWSRRARWFWRNHPGHAIALTARKLGLFWNRLDVDDLRILEQIRITDGLFRWPVWPGFLWFSLLGWVGLLCARKTTAGRLALWTGWLSVAAFFITARYRLTFVPLMAALGAAGITDLLREAWPQRQKRLWLLPVSIVIFLPVQLPDLRPVDYHNVAIQFLALDEPANALDVAETGVSFDPKNADLHHARGHALAELNDYASAAAAFERAAELRPGHPTALFNQALSLGRMGEICEAVAVLEQQLHARPDDVRARSLFEELREFCP